MTLAAHIARSRKCSRCRTEHDREGQRYCADCHSAYMRGWRPGHPLNEEHQARAVSRSKAGVAKRRGRLTPQPCAVCDGLIAEMHHIDHERPHDVTWLCRPCHLAWHTFWRSVVLSVFSKWLDGVRAAYPRPDAADQNREAA